MQADRLTMFCQRVVIGQLCNQTQQGMYCPAHFVFCFFVSQYELKCDHVFI